MNTFALLAVIAGASIALQASMNAQLGQLLGSSLLATSFAFFSSFILVGVVSAINSNGVSISSINLLQVPWYLWASGLFSVLGVASFYFLIPKMGAGNVMSFALTGQLAISIIISHFGFFDSPVKQVDWQKSFGIVMMIAGLILINKEAK